MRVRRFLVAYDGNIRSEGKCNEYAGNEYAGCRSRVLMFCVLRVYLFQGVKDFTAESGVAPSLRTEKPACYFAVSSDQKA